jgi:hypothetical protein
MENILTVEWKPSQESFPSYSEKKRLLLVNTMKNSISPEKFLFYGVVAGIPAEFSETKKKLLRMDTTSLEIAETEVREDRDFARVHGRPDSTALKVEHVAKNASSIFRGQDKRLQ